MQPCKHENIEKFSKIQTIDDSGRNSFDLGNSWALLAPLATKVKVSDTVREITKPKNVKNYLKKLKLAKLVFKIKFRKN